MAAARSHFAVFNGSLQQSLPASIEIERTVISYATLRLPEKTLD